MTTDRLATDITDKIIDSDDGRRLLVTALRLLAGGNPVTVAQLAAAAGVAEPDLAAAPAGGDIEYDDQGRITGWGLTLNPTPHAFTVGGHRLYTYCAPDTLIFPSLIGRPAQVESTDPATGTVIRLAVDPVGGVRDLDPPGAVVAIVDPGRLDPRQVRATLCDPQRFFASAETARGWQAGHPGMRVVPVAEGLTIARAIAESLNTPVPPGGCC